MVPLEFSKFALVGLFSLDFFNVQSFSSGSRSLQCWVFFVVDEKIQFGHIAHSHGLWKIQDKFNDALGIFRLHWIRQKATQTTLIMKSLTTLRSVFSTILTYIVISSDFIMAKINMVSKK